MGGGVGGYSHNNWVMVCGLLPKALTLFKPKSAILPTLVMIPLINQQSVVYKFTCDLCDANYRGGRCTPTTTDRSENSDFLLLRQKDPFDKVFSEIYFQSSSDFTFLWNLGKFEIPLNQPRWPMEFMQNTGQYRKKGTCLDFIFTQFVIYTSIIPLS